MRPVALTLTCLILFAGAASATTFVVPDDAELIAKSAAIAIGTVEGSYVQETDGVIETVYEIRLEQSLKSVKALPPTSALLSIVSPGGVLGDRAMHVEASAHFNQGDRVLLFLTRHKDRWTTTDLTLGKFRFVTSTKGDQLLVRDMEDVVGWDRNGQVHHEQVRRRDGFLQFIHDRTNGRAAQADDYLVDASEVTLTPEKPAGRLTPIANAAPFPGPTYTSWVSNQPTRWSNMAAGVTFRKVASQNISGVADGGVAVIQNGLAAWTNEPGSIINLIYGGTTTTPSTSFDGINVVEFNDPQNRISGSWTGSGTIGICFNSFSSSHSFGGTTWWSISDADVVFQNGYPGTHSSFPTAMTHELGHGIGWRHSNQNHTTQGAACNPAVEECTSAAIMNSSVNSSIGYTLQTWDVNAAQSVYPGTGGPTCTPVAITGQPQSATIASGSSRTLSVTASGTAPFTYQWYTGSSGNTSNPISGATGSSVTVSPTTTTSYWVRVSNACGTANSTTATITVTTTPPPPTAKVRYDHDGDGKADILWRHLTSGANWMYLMNGNVITSSVGVSTVADLNWQPAGIGDFNGDGKADIFWRNNANGQNMVYLMNGNTVLSSGATDAVANTAWRVGGIGDLNADGKDDVVWRNIDTGQNWAFLMNGIAVATSASINTESNLSWQIAGVGDFNNDKKADILLRNSSTGANWMYLMNGTTITQSVSVQSMADLGWQVAGVADFNGNGTADILWHHGTTGENRIFLMNGNSVVQNSTVNTEANTAWRVANTADYNGDGKADILWRNISTGQNWMYMMNGATITSSLLVNQEPNQAWRIVR
jgi:hypothetical protein